MLGTTIQPEGLFHPDRWPRRPYCTGDLEKGIAPRGLKQALKFPYLQCNPPNLRAWIVLDCDYPCPAGAWMDAPLPPPTWATINPDNGHAHLVWGLKTPVLMDGVGVRNAPIRYLCAIESLMREKLNADPGYSGLMTKNPRHSRWLVKYGPSPGYQLREKRWCGFGYFQAGQNC